jgi:hypothetical protein
MASPHQAVMVIGQFIAITLSNIAFLRIFLEIAERKKIAAAHELAVTNERADAMLLNSLNLKNILQEREEIIRQLSLFNKTAGMGALVASLAHELNQPLAVIQMNTEMLDLVLSAKDDRPQNRESLHVALSGLKKANVRASTVVSTLRDMFGNGRKADSNFDVNQIVKDVLLLCESAIHKNSIDVEIELHPGPLIFNGDKSQFQQVVLNLITNANEAISQDFARRRNISIATQQLDNQILLKVSDSGSGIAPEISVHVEAESARVLDQVREQREEIEQLIRAWKTDRLKRVRAEFAALSDQEKANWVEQTQQATPAALLTVQIRKRFAERAWDSPLITQMVLDLFAQAVYGKNWAHPGEIDLAMFAAHRAPGQGRADVEG